MDDDLEADYAQAKAVYREALARVTRAKHALHPPKPRPEPVPLTAGQIAFNEKVRADASAAMMTWAKEKLRNDLQAAAPGNHPVLTSEQIREAKVVLRNPGVRRLMDELRDKVASMKWD